MQSVRRESLRWLQFERLSNIDRLIHGVSLRFGDDESAEFNLADHVGAGKQDAISNRRRWCNALGASFDRLTCSRQVHSARVVHVDPVLAGKGNTGRQAAIPEYDGLFTELTDTPLMVLAADCALVVVYDPTTPAVGVVHASWRGTVAGACTSLVHAMQRCYQSDTSGYRAGISPSAGPRRYQVGEDVYQAAANELPDVDRFFPATKTGRCFDLPAANQFQLTQCGLSADNIEVAGICTIEQSEKFYSYRQQRDAAGRFGLLAALK